MSEAIPDSVAVVALHKIREVFLLEEEVGLYSFPEKKKLRMVVFFIERFMSSVLEGTSNILFAVSPFERIDGHYVSVWKMHCLEKYRPKAKGKWVPIKELKPENLKDGYKSYHSILSAMPYYKYQITVNDWAKSPQEDLQKLQSQLLENKGSVFWEDFLIRYSLKMDDQTIKDGLNIILNNISTSIPTKGELFCNVLESTIRSIGTLLELECFIRWGREHEKELKLLTTKQIKPYRKAFAMLDLSLKKGILKLMVPDKPNLEDNQFDLEETDESLGVTNEVINKLVKQRSTHISIANVNLYPFLPNVK